MKPQCKPGDLGIVIDAFHSCNIVKVLAPHDGGGELAIFIARKAWLVESPHPMTWRIDKIFLHRKLEPISDKFLNPIRGKPTDMKASLAERACELSSQSEPLATLA